MKSVKDTPILSARFKPIINENKLTQSLSENGAIETRGVGERLRIGLAVDVFCQNALLVKPPVLKVNTLKLGMCVTLPVVHT